MNEPLAVGVPEIMPVADLIDTPAGSVPDESDQVYGVEPPEPESVVL